MAVNKINRRLRLRKGIRRNLKGTGETPRLCVYRSNRSIYVQAIDDIKGNTLVAASSFELGLTGNAKIEDCKEVGKKIAEKALKAGITSVVFDRSGYKYHGKIKALAEGAREGGLKF